MNKTMNCPVCNETLLMTNRLEVEIDYCPNCRGIWLDRGELDKIIERSVPQATQKPYSLNALVSQHHDDDDDHYKHSNLRGHEHSGYNQYGVHKKKRGFLGELFDF